MSHAKNVSLALDARLKTIKKVNGFLTDAGTRVFRGKRRLAEDEIPASVIVEAEDTILDRMRVKVKLNQQYLLEAHDVCDPDHPNDKAHELLADLKKAVFGDDLTLGGLCRQILYEGRFIGTREDGVALVFARIVVTVEYAEDLANP
jgi:hypothetical protein